ncbi:hypothetical protein [Pedobacter helvus]|uniref:Uncharacterized protein n=1 Tax=Pedobacter helvus TaxID=2563444 RepID=A0ABW9JC95_9SPHI|nr:hypothetical protein [Pedobacter ureilyticus]
MQKQLDDFAEIKSLFLQFLATSKGIEEVTKSTIMSIINDGNKSEKLSPIDLKQEEIAQIRQRNALKNIQKASKNHSKCSLSKL